MATSKKTRKTRTRTTKATPKASAPYASLVKKAEAGVVRNRKKAEALVELIRARLGRIERDFHAVGVALNKLSAPAMYAAMGYRSFADLLKGEKLLPRTTAYRLMAVAEAFAAKDVKALGAAKAYALLSYAEATPAADVAREMVRGDVKIGRKRVSKMSYRELTEAGKRVRAVSGRASERSEGEKEARRAARKLQASLRKRGMKSAKGKALRADGVWGVSIVLSTEDAAALT